MAATVEWIVGQSSLGEMRVLAGAKNIKNIISSVNLMDNPDTIRWLTKGEFILSTGYLFRENTWLRNNIISELSMKNCSGMGIVLKRYMDDLPAIMIEQAEKFDFPIISIPYELSLSEISRIIYKKIFDDETHDIIKNNELYQRLISMISRENGLSGLLTEITSIIKNTVFLLNTDMEIIDYTAPKNISSKLSDFIFVSERHSALPENILDILNKNRENKQFSATIQKLKGRYCDVDCIIFPIVNDADVTGYLCFLEEHEKFLTKHYNFVRSIEPLVAIGLLKHYIEKNNKVNIKNNFLKCILFDNISTSEIETQCELHSFDHVKPRICIIIQLKNYTNLQIEKRNALERSTSIIIDSISNHSFHTYKLKYDNNIILFMLSDQQTASVNSLLSYGKQVCEMLSDKLNIGRVTFKIGLSSVYAGSDTIRLCFSQALETIRVGSKLDMSKQIYSYNENELYHIIIDGMDKNKIINLYKQTVWILDNYDEENKAELIPTLSAYFESNFNISEASKKLFIHRNTMNYRLDKIRDLIGCEPKELSAYIKLQMGMYAKNILDNEIV